MTKAEFISILRSKGYDYTLYGDTVVVTHRGNVYLRNLNMLPEGVTFENGGGVYLGSLTMRTTEPTDKRYQMKKYTDFIAQKFEESFLFAVATGTMLAALFGVFVTVTILTYGAPLPISALGYVLYVVRGANRGNEHD